jgi:hypothetical protein
MRAYRHVLFLAFSTAVIHRFLLMASLSAARISRLLNTFLNRGSSRPSRWNSRKSRSNFRLWTAMCAISSDENIAPGTWRRRSMRRTIPRKKSSGAFLTIHAPNRRPSAFWPNSHWNGSESDKTISNAFTVSSRAWEISAAGASAADVSVPISTALDIFCRVEGRA